MGRVVDLGGARRFNPFALPVRFVADIFRATIIRYSNGAMAEWSKAVDLSPPRTYSTGEIRVGSNPTGTIKFFEVVGSIFFV